MKVTEKLSSIENEHFIISLRLIIKMKNVKPNSPNDFTIIGAFDHVIKSSKILYKGYYRYKELFIYSDIPSNDNEFILIKNVIWHHVIIHLNVVFIIFAIDA